MSTTPDPPLTFELHTWADGFVTTNEPTEGDDTEEQS